MMRYWLIPTLTRYSSAAQQPTRRVDDPRLARGQTRPVRKTFLRHTEEAERMAQAAKETGLVLSEAFHFRYHPLATRIKAILASGELGALRHVEGHMCYPLPLFNNIRWRWDLAGARRWMLVPTRSTSFALSRVKNLKSRQRTRSCILPRWIATWRQTSASLVASPAD